MYNAGFAMATNRSKARTFIGENVTINCPNANISVEHDYTSNAEALMVSAAAGGIGAGVTVTMVINALDAVSYVGSIATKADGTIDTSVPVSGSIIAKTMDITANSVGTSSVTGASISGGSVAVNGVVALAFNNIQNKAIIGRMPVELRNGDLNVIATMCGLEETDNGPVLTM